jgi:hypothetical protein
MRKILAFMLLAGAAVPAIAAGDPDDRRANREERQEARQQQQQQRAERAEHSARSNDAERPRFSTTRSHDGGGNVEQSARTVHVDHNGQGSGGGNAEQRNYGRFRQVQAEGGAFTPAEDGNRVRTERMRTREQLAREQIAVDRNNDGPRVITPSGTEGARLRQHDRALPNVLRTRTPIVSQVPREGTQPPLRQASRRDGKHWSNQWRSSWRNDHKYDWRNWRNRHRSIFRLGFYYDPFGWNYRPYSIGWRLWPSYYSSRFWINDPWQYRLPYAPPGTRWIRYYNDAILVDSFTGEVVDVIYDFFW